jgi:peptide/nickel transport system substrate-binding protein
MNKRKFCWFLFTVLTIGLLLPQIGFSADKPLVIAFRGDAARLDPHSRNETTTTTIQRHFYEALVKFDKNLKPSPSLAVSWKNIDDLTWEFKLRKGVSFQNGEPFNAAVAKFSIERCKTHKQSQYKYMVPDYESITVVDDHTLRYKTKAPTPEMLVMLESVSMVPPKYFSKWDAKDWTHLNHNPIGTGPYKFVEWIKDDHLTMTANKDWWGGKVDFPEVIIRPIPEDATRVAALISGEIDVCWGVPIPDIPRVEKDKGTYVSRVQSQRAIYLMFDVYTDKGGKAPEMQPGLPAGKPNPFKNFKVRKAVAHAINVDEIIEFVMEGSAYPASELICKYADGFNPNIKRPKFDPELSKKLLAEAGYPNGFAFNFDCPNDRYINDQSVTEAIAHQLTKVGLKPTVVAQPKAVFFPKMSRHESPLFLAGWGTLSWQGTFNGFFKVKKGSVGRNNRGRYKNPEMEKRIDAANSEMDDEKRQALRRKVAEDIYATGYVIPLYYQENVFAFNNRVEGKARVDERIYAFDLKKK